MLTVKEMDALYAEWEQRMKEEGRKEGRKEGEGLLLNKLLVQRFGPLPEGVVARIRQADSATLERWAERLLSASTLDEVFAA